MSADEVIAWHYKVTMAETRNIAKTVVIKHPHGRILFEDTGSVETNATFGALGRLGANDIPPVSGTYTFEIRFPDDPGLPVLTDSREIVIGSCKSSRPQCSSPPPTQ